MAGQDDVLVQVAPMAGRVLEYWPDWRTYLLGSSAPELQDRLRLHEATGPPLGSRGFVERIEALLGRRLLPQKRGPKPKAKHESRRN